jgi:hypothetical protein
MRLPVNTKLPFFIIHTFDFCYIFAIPKTSSEVVISFFNEGRSISPGLPFCNFAINTIYVL